MLSAILERTLCRIGLHSRKGKGVRKYDGGRCSLLCRHCYQIIGRWHA